jgi:hypothetical protein
MVRSGWWSIYKVFLEVQRQGHGTTRGGVGVATVLYCVLEVDIGEE